MRLADFAAQYVASRGIRKVPICSAKRFVATVGEIQARDITQAEIDRYVSDARNQHIPEWTIKGTVKDVRTLARAAAGTILRNPVRKPLPDPRPCDIADIDAMWDSLAPWSQQLVVLLYWTAARLEDGLRLQLTLSAEWRVISWEAHKTKRRHKLPVPEWLQPWLTPGPLPYHNANDHSKTIVRAELDRAANLTGIPRVLPSHIRDRSLTEWSKIHCGSIIHGCGMGDTRDHYVPPIEVLIAHQHKLRLPACFGAVAAPEETLLQTFRRLDPDAQRLISGTAERLANTG